MLGANNVPLLRRCLGQASGHASFPKASAKRWCPDIRAVLLRETTARSPFQNLPSRSLQNRGGFPPAQVRPNLRSRERTPERHPEISLAQLGAPTTSCLHSHPLPALG